jgi:hypothetical protein
MSDELVTTSHDPPAPCGSHHGGPYHPSNGLRLRDVAARRNLGARLPRTRHVWWPATQGRWGRAGFVIRDRVALTPKLRHAYQ